jgi:glyoxylase-like metal-dependent hydrolase (beta-lactamase superfamily II)
MSWFDVQEIVPGVWRASDAGADNIYSWQASANGSDRYRLWHRRSGGAGRQFGAAPALVINTHAHPDTLGQLSVSKRVLMSEPNGAGPGLAAESRRAAAR